MDFNDVFGGPPRRFSMQEDRMKNRFSGTQESEREGCSNPWRSPKEMPVFGEENMSGRSHSGGDFYDDIFGGNENFTSPRNNYDRESFLGRSPSSKFMSPAMLSPIKPEGLGGHAPPIFSLPRKMVTAKDLFYSKSGLSGEDLSRTTSRFSDKAHEQVAMDDESLSYESSVRYQYWSSLATSDGKDTENLNKERENADYDVEHRFHFSIYKWAGKGVPMVMPVKISSMPAAKKSDVSPGSFTRRFQDIYQEVFGKVDDIESPEGIDKTVVFEEMVKPPVLNDIQVKSRKEIPGGIKKTREISATEIEIPWDADGGQNKKGAEGISTRDEVSYQKVEIIDSEKRNESLRRNQSYRWGGILSRQSRNRASTNAPNETGKLSSHYADPTPDYSFEEEEQQYPSKTATYTSDNSYFTTTKASPLGMFQEGSNVSLENDEDISEVNFVVEVLSDDAPTEALDDPKVIDAKILQWSAGKKGNIHSLLSTLQFVLWPESGWKPIPLVDLLEANSVKKAYQKALLQLHPDKLQQKNAASHQKYIAEKVFDILQEAWDHFNNLEPQ